MEEKAMNIYQKIHAIMSEVDYVQKGDKKVDNQYKYVSHDAVSALIHQQVVKHGVVVLPIPTETIIEQFQGKKTGKDGKSYDATAYLAKVKVTLRFVNVDNPADFMESPDWPGMGIDSQDKAVGKAVSYACKYGLLKVFLLETGDDPETDQDTHYERGGNAPKATAQAAPQAALPAPTEVYKEIDEAKTVIDLGKVTTKYKRGLNLMKIEDPASFEKIQKKLTDKKISLVNAMSQNGFAAAVSAPLNDEIPF